MDKKDILDNYSKNLPIYRNLKNKIEILLKELLLDNVNYHYISSRVKEKDSLSKKLTIKENKYSSINDITDIVGCRIISYFEDDVDTIVNILKKEFVVDIKNSVNKKDNIQSNKFGYLSYHIICSISPERLNLVEYQKYEDLKFEIQVRSILQHAWAEIEHDIGYKSRLEIPNHIRRKFSRIAGLLETADENFCDIKKEIFNYQEKIKDDDELLSADLNLDSLYLYTLNSSLVLSIDQQIAINSNTELDVEEASSESLSSYLEALLYFKIRNIKDLNKLLQEKEKIIPKFSEYFLNKDEESYSGGTFMRGISYFYLTYLLSVEDKNTQFTQDYIKNNIYQTIFKGRQGYIDSLVNKLQDTYKKIS